MDLRRLNVPDDAGRKRVEFALHYYRHLSHLHTFVREHLHEPFSLDDVASSVGLSPSRISHLFHEKTGICFRDWVRLQRVCKAQDVLRSNDVSISAVARAAGFRNVRALERAFRQVLNQTPTEFRNAVILRGRRHPRRVAGG